MSLQNKRILLTGAGGMLARELAPLLKERGAQVVLSARSPSEGAELALDITDEAQTRSVVESVRPDSIINCAAYTKVDLAETDYQNALGVNAVGAANLAAAAKRAKSKLVHISTDYVFGNASLEKREPFVEEAPVSPCGMYGHSKRLGEDFIRSVYPEGSVIVRTSWLHGIHGNNFIDTMLRVGKERGEVKVVNDQFGSPTWTGWLSEVIIGLLEKNATGVFHASSEGEISWFDFAKEIFLQAQMPVNVLPQSTEELNRPAPRPPYSVLSSKKVESLLGIKPFSWKESIERHLEKRKSEFVNVGNG